VILNQLNKVFKDLPPGPPAQFYPTIVLPYFSSLARTTLNPQENNAKLLYFEFIL